MKIFKSVFGKILIGSLISTIITLSVVGIIGQQRVTRNFDTFIQQRDEYYQGRDKRLPLQLKSNGFIKEQSLLASEQDFKSTVTRSILVASLVGLAVSAVISAIVSRQISQPLLELKKKVRKLKNNKYLHIKGEARSTIEIEELIKEFNELISELHRVESLRDELVADVTHELKTPLTKIMGQLEGAIDGLYKFDEVHANKVLDNVHQLEYLLSQLEKLTQIRAGKVKIELRDVDLSKLLDSLLSGYSKNGVDILHSVKKKTIIAADPYKLREILDNLISNAVRHTKKGSIEVSFNEGKIKIKDTGVGIPRKDKPYIFERFYRADKSRNLKTGGLGLGLSIVKELVELHSWQIKVRSVEGKGSTFIISTYI